MLLVEEDRNYAVESELGTPAPAKKKKKRWWGYLIDAVVIVAFLATLALSVNVIYISAAYDMPFFVNGMSMYPTLNRDGFDRNGNPLTWNSGETYDGYTVDYGYAKTGDAAKWRTDLHRYDVVVTYFPEDYQRDGGDYKRDENGHLVLRVGVKAKIKRVIGLPGESVHYYPCATDGEDFNRVWGKTVINEGAENEQTLKPLYGIEDYPAISGVGYAFRDAAKTWNLGEDQYILFGDNRIRNRSSDSYDKGAILGEMIVGKAELLVGKVTLANGEPTNTWAHFFSPWNYKKVA